MTLTGATNQVSYGTTTQQPQYIPPPQNSTLNYNGQQQQYIPPQPPQQQGVYPQSYQHQQQQMMMMMPQTTTTTITTPSNLQQYPNGGPVVESLIDTQASVGMTFSIQVSPQHLINSLSNYGYPNAANAPADIENSVMRPLNNIFSQFYTKTSNYDTYYMISFIVFMLFIVFTMGLGVVFIFIIFLFPYLKNRHVASFNDTVKSQVRNILDRENQTKWMPHGFEWIIIYSVKTNSNSFMTGMTCSQEAQLKLIRVSKQVQSQDLN